MAIVDYHGQRLTPKAKAQQLLMDSLMTALANRVLR